MKSLGVCPCFLPKLFSLNASPTNLGGGYGGEPHAGRMPIPPDGGGGRPWGCGDPMGGARERKQGEGIKMEKIGVRIKIEKKRDLDLEEVGR